MNQAVFWVTPISFASCINDQEVHRVQPFMQRDFRALENSVRANREIEGASQAAVVTGLARGAYAQRGDVLSRLAIRAHRAIGPQAAFEILTRGFFVGEEFEELKCADGGFRHLGGLVSGRLDRFAVLVCLKDYGSHLVVPLRAGDVLIEAPDAGDIAHDLYGFSSRGPWIAEFKQVLGRRALVASQLPDLLGLPRLRPEGSVSQPWCLHDYVDPELPCQLCELISFALIGNRQVVTVDLLLDRGKASGLRFRVREVHFCVLHVSIVADYMRVVKYKVDSGQRFLKRRRM
jgi:hypothetical protein